MPFNIGTVLLNELLWCIAELIFSYTPAGVNGLFIQAGILGEAFLWIPTDWFVHKGKLCKWSNPSGISAAPIPNNTVGSTHCGMTGSLWMVYRVYRILCCLSNVVVGNLLRSYWNTIPSEVISGALMWFNNCRITDWLVNGHLKK